MRRKRPCKRDPKYRLHKATGQGYVELNGRRIYLGDYESDAAQSAYHRLLAEWKSSGRVLPIDRERDDVTVVEIAAVFWDHVKRHYRKADGTPTTEVDNYRRILRVLKALYGPTPGQDFGAKALKAVRCRMIEMDWSRSHINHQVRRLKAVFSWAVEQELIPAGEKYHAMLAVKGLRKNKTEARETEPVRPVPNELIEPVLDEVASVVADMIRLQLLTGARPDEIARMRRCDVERREKVWVVRYHEHKTEHFEVGDRLLFLGPQAQKIIAPYMARRRDHEYLFSAADAAAEHRDRRHAKRKTPLNAGNRPGTNRCKSPTRSPGERFTVHSYRRAIHRACDICFPPPEDLRRIRARGKKGTRWETPGEHRTRIGPEAWAGLRAWRRRHRWSPNRLRHNAATHLRSEFGLEVAQTVLGHQIGSRITEIYAERNIRKATEVIAQVG